FETKRYSRSRLVTAADLKPRAGGSIEAPTLKPPFKELSPMTVRVAINGFGRIGRLVLRSFVEHGRKDIEVVAINALGPVETNARLLRYDSVHGRFPGTVTTGEDWIDVGLGKIKVTAERDPSKLPHKALNVDIALECTGLF